MNSKTVTILFLLFLYGNVTYAASADWSVFRGPNQDGSAPAGSKFPMPAGGKLGVAWRAALGPGYSGVVISGKHAVTLFSDGVKDSAVAYDVATGKELWRTPVAPTYKGHDGSHDGPIATPVIADDRAIGFLPRGELFALDLHTGKTLWSTDVSKEHGGKKPFYGYAASPVVADGVVVVQIGAEKGSAFAGFDVSTGKLRWSLGDDAISYQSPILMEWKGNTHVVAVGDTKLFGIDPKGGKILWQYAHGGEKDAIAIEVMVPVPAGAGRLLLKNKRDTSALIQIVEKNGKAEIVSLWNKNVFRNTHSIPVYHEGYFYGYNGRILTCVDANTGELRWRSREPGDGFLMLLDGHLVIQTKHGSLHVGEANPKGWSEKGRLNLFSNISWSLPSFAGGSIFTRSQSEMARVEWRTVTAAVETEKPLQPQATPAIGKSKFAQFLNEVASADDKKQVVDRFLASISNYPLIEWPDMVHFLFRGEAQDMAIAGDMVRERPEETMKRVPGTDLYYWTTRLEPDARLNYRFVKNYDESIADPMNPRKLPHPRFKEISWLAMPGWKEPSYLRATSPESSRGRMESHEIKSRLRENTSIKVDVYLPASYRQGNTRYPVAYIFGPDAKDAGLIETSFNNLFHDSKKTAIGVIVGDADFGSTRPPQNEVVDAEADFIAKEVVPFIDSTYRTIPNGPARIAVGGGFNGFFIFLTAFKYPGLFSNLAVHSMFLVDSDRQLLVKHMRDYRDQPMQIYVDWGEYDARSITEGWDVAEMTRKMVALLHERGYKPAGGETHEGYGWGSWRNRTDRWLSSFLAAASDAQM